MPSPNTLRKPAALVLCAALAALLLAGAAAAPAQAQTGASKDQEQQALGSYRSRMEVANAQALKDMKALQPQLPAFAYGPLASGFERALGLVGDFMAGFAAGETAAVAGVSALLDFIDSIPGGYSIDPGPPLRLLFTDQAKLDRYQALMGQVQLAAQQGPKARARLVQALAERPARP